MQTIQLYIEGTRVDMFKDESVTITDTIKNIKDVSKIFTEFSKTFSLPASKTNNKLFKHYYNFNIVNGYDARVRVTARIELNHLPYKKGFVKLEGVKLKDNKPHTYKITFFGNTVSLKEKFGEDKLSDLTWLDNFNTDSSNNPLLFNPTHIRNYLQNSYNKTIGGVTYTTPVQVPLLTGEQRLYYDSSDNTHNTGNLYYQSGNKHGVNWNELKYALKLEVIIKAIEEQYNIDFSTDFFNGSNYHWKDLYMWLHRTKGKVTTGSQIANFETLVDGFTPANSQGVVSESTGGTYVYLYNSVDYPYFNLALFPDTGYTGVTYQYKIYAFGLAIFQSGNVTGNQTYTSTIYNTPVGVPIYVEIVTSQQMNFSNIRFRAYGEIQGTPFFDTYQTSQFNIPPQLTFQIRQQMPEMKVIDFMTGLFKMFNLVAYVDQDTGTIVVKTLDSFFSGGTSYDISKFIDVNDSEVDAALPFREVTYTYEGLDTFLAAQHDQLVGKEWGKEEFRNNTSTTYSGEIYNVTAPFEHMKFERLYNLDNSTLTNFQWGYCVDDNQEAYIGKPILIFLLRSGYSTYSFVDDVDPDGTVNTNVSNVFHWRPGNQNYYAPTTTALQNSINFFPEADEYSGQTNTNTLFNAFHTTYITSVFQQSRRISKFTAYLPQRILLNYKLSDRFVINGQSYKINSITTNLLTGKSELELLNE